MGLTFKTEAMAAETELLHRCDLHATLCLPRAVQQLWREPQKVAICSAGDARIIRFDFHFTTDGWQISEANIDTPGGWIEASGYSGLMHAHYSGTASPGDPTAALADAISVNQPHGALVGLIHATAYTEDRAMMVSLQKLLERGGLRGCLISPAQLR